MDEEYLSLFKKIKEDDNKKDDDPMLKETPDYSQYKNINEINKQYNQSQNLNVNEFNIETKINGQGVNRINEADPNGLNHLIGNENLNEVKIYNNKKNVNEVVSNRKLQQQKHLEKLKRKEKEEQEAKLNEVVNFKDSDIITVDMFNKANFNCFMVVANKINPQ